MRRLAEGVSNVNKLGDDERDVAKGIGESLVGRTVSGVGLENGAFTIEFDHISKLVIDLVDHTIGFYTTRPS